MYLCVMYSVIGRNSYTQVDNNTHTGLTNGFDYWLAQTGEGTNGGARMLQGLQ